MPRSPQQSDKISVRFVSLGCPKNLVDSEVMAGILQKDQFSILPPDQATDVGVVNTCGFIDASKKESIDTILELAQEKKAGRLKLLIVSGCLSQRYAGELPKLLPEVDAFIGTGDFKKLSQIIHDKMGGEKKRDFIRYPEELPTSETPRAISTPFYTRFVKVSEGCSHACSFCTIPMMRGGLKSRTSDDVVAEISKGIESGVKEFNLIAQDLNEFGRDLAERDSLYNLFEKLSALKGDFWIRPLYMYPLQFPDKLIRLMSEHPHVIPYVDIPLQHIDDRILKSMKRGSSSKYIYRLIEGLRKQIPGIILRTTFIVGYPGETEEEFERLHDFIREMKFDRLGVFTYSDEEGTAAFDIADRVPQKTKEERRDRLMRLQQEISLQKNKGYVGKSLKVLYEGENAPEGYQGTGRFYGQAPEIDGQVYFKFKPGQKPPKAGSFINARVIEALEYDLVAEAQG